MVSPLTFNMAFGMNSDVICLSQHFASILDWHIFYWLQYLPRLLDIALYPPLVISTCVSIPEYVSIIFVVRAQDMAPVDWSRSGHLKWGGPPDSFLMMKDNSHSETFRAFLVNSFIGTLQLNTIFDNGRNIPVSFPWVSVLCPSCQQQVSVAWNQSNLP